MLFTSYGGVMGVSVSRLVSCRASGTTSVAVICGRNGYPHLRGGVTFSFSSSDEIEVITVSPTDSAVISCSVGVVLVGGSLLRELMGSTMDVGRRSFRHSVVRDGIRGLHVCNFRTGNFSLAISSVRDCFSTGVRLLSPSGYGRLFGERHPVCAGIHSSVPTVCNLNSDIGGSLITGNYVVSNRIRGSVLFHNMEIRGNTIIGGSVLYRNDFITSNSSLGCAIASGDITVAPGGGLSNTRSCPICINGNVIVWHNRRDLPFVGF